VVLWEKKKYRSSFYGEAIDLPVVSHLHVFLLLQAAEVPHILREVSEV